MKAEHEIFREEIVRLAGLSELPPGPPVGDRPIDLARVMVRRAAGLEPGASDAAVVKAAAVVLRALERECEESIEEGESHNGKGT